MKKAIIFLLVLITLIFPLTVRAEKTGEEKAMLDSKDVDLNVLPLNLKESNGEKIVLLRDLGEIYEWNFSYNSEKKEVTIYNKSGSYSFKITEFLLDDPNISENKKTPIIREGRTYINLDLINPLLAKLNEMKAHLVTNLEVESEVIRSGQDFKSWIEVYNISDENLRLHFSSGQLYDLYLRKENELIWQWSDDKYFTMAIQYKELAAGDELIYEETVPGINGPGEYVFTGEIKTQKTLPLAELMLKVIK